MRPRRQVTGCHPHPIHRGLFPSSHDACTPPTPPTNCPAPLQLPLGTPRPLEAARPSLAHLLRSISRSIPQCSVRPRSTPVTTSRVTPPQPPPPRARIAAPPTLVPRARATHTHHARTHTNTHTQTHPHPHPHPPTHTPTPTYTHTHTRAHARVHTHLRPLTTVANITGVTDPP